jgi:UDP-glucose 4-epimerase
VSSKQPLSPSGRRLLLTGAAGFIGSRLARELCQAGWSVLGVDDLSGGWPERLCDHPNFAFRELDVTEPGAMVRLLAHEGPFTDLVHLAARVGVRMVLRDPEGCRSANLRAVHELLAAVDGLSLLDRPRVLAASSSEVYVDRPGPLREGDPTRPTASAGRWAYAASKLSGEFMLDGARDLWRPERAPVHLRFFNVVGPGQDSETGMVLPTFVERALAGEPIPVHGDGEQVRTFAHVDEVARTLRQALELPVLPPGALNVGGTARTSILDLARCVRTTSGAMSAIEHDDPRVSLGANFEEVAYREPDLARLRALGLEVPAASLEAIVTDTLENHLRCVRPAGPASPRAALPRVACASPAS